jgi:PAS domain S-box-containing protein
MRAIRQFLRSYRIVLIAVLLATVQSLLFWSLGPRVPLGLFIAAVLVSAWQGGMRSAVLATGLATVILAIIGRYQSPVPEDDMILRLGMFVLVGLIAGYLSQQCKQAIRAVEHVHDVLGGSGIAVFAADTAGRVTSLNPLARTLTGRGDADAHGRPLKEILRLVHRTSRSAIPMPPPGTGTDLPEDAVLVGASGHETAVEGSIAPVRDSDGRPAGVMAVLREAGGRAHAVQELRQRAERFRAMAGYAPAGLMVLDAEGRCVFCNPAAQAACGCSADECLGEGWSRHVQPQDRDRLISDWLKAVVSKAPFLDEFRVLPPTGTPHWLRVRSAPMLADNGEVLGHVAAFDEITEHRQTTEALADARRESEEHLQEWAASEKKAEEAARKLQAQLDQHSTALRRAEEAHRAASAEAGRRLQDESTRRRQAEEALEKAGKEAQERNAAQKRGHQQARAELEQRLQEEAAARRRAEAELQQLHEELAGHREGHERLQSQLAEQGGKETSLRQKLDQLADEAAALRQAQEQLRVALEEKAQQEEAARGERQFLEAVIDGSPAGIFAHDSDGRCRVWNAALERLLGRPRSDALGRTEAELFPPVERSGSPPADGAVAPDGAVRADLTTMAVIGRSEVLESAHAAVRDPAGEVLGGMALVRVLPQQATHQAARAASENGKPHRPGLAPAGPRLGDGDWLAFN